ncbi:MAG: galactose mutarotase [Lachnospiraceae bacterium]|nr:galactose mutarotase [Lachnospiraceae bacterium]
MEIRKFGVTEKGEETSLITLKNSKGMIAELTDMGASLVSLIVPDRDGKPVDVVLGYPTSEAYEHNANCFGATIGRNGNRIANGHFVINGKEYQMVRHPLNGHNLHSQPDTFYTRKWGFTTEDGPDAECVTFTLYSPDGDQGFPGNMDIEVTYTLTEDNELMIDYYGFCDQDTVMNMTNHSYFNLNGEGSGDILGHEVQLYSDYITETDSGLIPTGNLTDVTGTPFDFREAKTIGQDIDQDDEALHNGLGYDHNFVVNGGKRQEDAQLIGRVKGDQSGIVMEIYTDLPGVQMYTSNGMEQPNGKNGHAYHNHAGVCFETQFAPNAVNIPAFESPVIKANKEVTTLTVYRFAAE